MGDLKVFAVVVLCAVFVLSASAEPNNINTASVQKAITEQHQIITATPEPVIEKQSQSQSSSIEQIIEKAHQYYDSALDKALTVISILVGLLVIVFAFLSIIIEWQRNISFKKQLNEKEKQLQKYFDNRLKEEAEQLKEQAQKQVAELTHQIKQDISKTYVTLAYFFKRFNTKNESSWDLVGYVYFHLLSCLNDVDIKRYDSALNGIISIKKQLSNISDRKHIKLLNSVIDPLSEKVMNTTDENLKKAFNEFNEAYIVRKHEIGSSPNTEEQD